MFKLGNQTRLGDTYKSPHIFYSSQCVRTKQSKAPTKRAGNPNKSEQMMEQLTTYIHGYIATSCLRDMKFVHVVVWLCMCFRNMTEKHTNTKASVSGTPAKIHPEIQHQPMFQSKMSGRNLFFWLHYTNVYTKINEKNNKLFSRSGPWICRISVYQGERQQKHMSHPKKNTYFALYWLVNRDPHNGSFQSPRHWVLFHTMSSCISTQTTRGPFFIADMASSAAKFKGVGSFRRC